MLKPPRPRRAYPPEPGREIKESSFPSAESGAARRGRSPKRRPETAAGNYLSKPNSRCTACAAACSLASGTTAEMVICESVL